LNGGFLRCAGRGRFWRICASRHPLCSRQATVAARIPARFQERPVVRSPMEYVRGEVHTNNIESFWSLLKRGVVGTYHNVSKQYLPLYLNEFSFRFNNRENPDIFDAILRGC
jgi:transposase-like protein